MSICGSPISLFLLSFFSCYFSLIFPVMFNTGYINQHRLSEQNVIHLGGLNNRNVFLTFWRLRSQRWRCQLTSDELSYSEDCLLAACPHNVEKKRALVLSFSASRDSNPIMGGCSLIWPNYLLEASPPSKQGLHRLELGVLRFCVSAYL